MADKNTDTRHISAKRSRFYLGFSDVRRYSDLIRFYTRKNIVVTYRQTVLGPVWLVLSPLLNSLIQMFIFGYLAGFKTGGVPKIVFYLFSNTAWNVFQRTFNSDSAIYTQNERLFGKVFFPRLAISYSNMLTTAVVTGFQLLMGFLFVIFFWIQNEIVPAWTFLFMVFPLLLLALMGQGLGLICASVVVKYRDMKHLFPMIIRILMYVSPVVFPLSQFTNPMHIRLLLLNPFTAPLELVRAFIWNAPYPPIWSIVYSFAAALLINLLGIMYFHRKERTFIDLI